MAKEKNIVEETIIGCLLLNDNLFNELYLQPKHFLNDNNKFIFSKMLDLKRELGKVDVVLLTEKLQNDTYLVELAMDYAMNVTTINNFHYYQEKQEELYKSYKLKEKFDKFNKEEINYETFIEEANKLSKECNDSSNSCLLNGKDIFELITTNSSTLEFDTYKGLGQQLKIPKNTVEIIAARTSQGKSALALNLANDLAKNYKCVYFNLEMTEKELYQRLASINSNVPIDDMYNVANNNKGDKIWHGIEEITKRKFKIYNNSKSLKGIRTILTKESREEHVVAFIDYVGLITTGKSNQSDTERVGEIMRELKRITADINCTIFAVAQLNRDGEGKEPCLANLKDSGELEQTGHCIMIIHNPNPDITNPSPEIKVFVLKNRSGKCGVFRMIFDKPTQRFIMQ